MAASLTVPALPPTVDSTPPAPLGTRTSQTLDVRLAALMELTTEGPSAAPKALTTGASATAVRPPAGYSPYYPFTTPTTPLGSLGWWVTLPIAIPGLVFDSLAQSWTRDLTDKGLDARLANQPELLSRYLLVPIAVTIQTALTGLIGGGTVELGKFTLPQAVFWAAKSLRVAIANTIAAEKNLLSGGTGVLPEDESVAVEKPIAPTTSVAAATATTEPRVATRSVPSAPADTRTRARDDEGDSPETLSEQSPTVTTSTGRTDGLRRGSTSLPGPFTRSRPAAASPASPPTRHSDPERRPRVKSSTADRG